MAAPQPTQPGAQGSVAIVGNHYQVGKKIGEGSFGVVFEGTNLLNGHIIAIKFEPRKSDAPQLRDEYRSYRILQGCPGIPQAYYYGTEGLHNVLCIDLLGPNLEDLFDLCGRKFTVKTVAMLAKQMIERVQSIHEKNLIYRDIKPDNFLIGLPGGRMSDTVYMVDFGMAKLWRDPRTRQHIPYRERKSLSGTARYMSINTHLGREQSRRDDLEGLGHVFMYFLRGSLPWQGLKAANNKQKYERIGERKQTVPIAELCDGFPEEFSIYLNYVRKLGFEETPDYDFLKELFVKVLRVVNEVDDSMFDWKLLNNGKGWEANSKLPSNLLPQLAHHGGAQHRSRDNTASPRQHRSSAIPANANANAAGGGPATPGGSMNPPQPAALGRHASKQRKHNSAGLDRNATNSPSSGIRGNTADGRDGAGSTGLLVGSARASRAISPLQTQTQVGGGGPGNPILMPSPSPINGQPPQQQQQQHPYAAAGAGMHTPAPYARAEYGGAGVANANGNGNGGVYGGGVPGGSGMLAGGSMQHGQSGQQQRNSMMVNGNGGIGTRGQIQQGLPEERSLPAPPRKVTLLDMLRCRCG